jgi:uncharacterized membrane protein
MLLKTTIKLVLGAIWVCLFNFIPIVIIQGIQSNTNKEFQYLLNFLYGDSIDNFPISLLLLIIGFILFLFADYYYEKNNPNESIKKIVKTYLGSSFAITFLLGFLMQIGLGITFIPKIIWVFIIKIPFERGWYILFNDKFSYFQNPTIIFELYNENLSKYEFWIITILSIVYLMSFWAFVSKLSNKVRFSEKVWEEKKETIIIFLLRIYFIYLTPFIFVLIYPILLNGFNLLPTNSFPIKTSYIFWGCIFLVVLVMVIFHVIKHNIKVNRELLKEEIKKEVMEEFNKSQ